MKASSSGEISSSSSSSSMPSSSYMSSFPSSFEEVSSNESSSSADIKEKSNRLFIKFFKIKKLESDGFFSMNGHAFGGYIKPVDALRMVSAAHLEDFHGALPCSPYFNIIKEDYAVNLE